MKKKTTPITSNNDFQRYNAILIEEMKSQFNNLKDYIDYKTELETISI